MTAADDLAAHTDTRRQEGQDFGTFTTTHPELWESIGQAWEMQRRSDLNERAAWRIRYRTMREIVCVVGKFDEGFFDAECEKAFG